MAQENIRNPELVLALNVFKAEDTPAARRAIATALGTAKLLAPVVLEQLPQEQPGTGAPSGIRRSIPRRPARPPRRPPACISRPSCLQGSRKRA